MGSSLPLMPTTPPLPHKDPDPSSLHPSELVVWHTRHVEMLPWWEVLTTIPSHKDYKKFFQKVCASFKVPKACNWVKGVDNYHTPLLANPSISKHHFLPPKNVRFGSQDICLILVQHTNAYVRGLQNWVVEEMSSLP